MAKLWTRMVMGLIFVFATIASPLHALATPMTGMAAHAASTPAMEHQMSVAGMSEACARAMAADMTAANTHAKSNTAKAPTHHGKDGCCDGCNCPLSHCPATPPALVSEAFALLHIEATVVLASDAQILRSRLADALKRPPRA